MLRSEGQPEKAFDAKDLKAVSADGFIYESVYHTPNGMFSGANAPGHKLMLLLYASPAIRLYLFLQTNDYVYHFPATALYKYYTPFDKGDGASYLTNYNKKLAAVFKDCGEVSKQIANGDYALKQENSRGPVQALLSYEKTCGSKEPEKHSAQLEREAIKKLYR